MDLASWCNELVAVTSSAEAWVGRNPELVRNEKEGLLKELRRGGRIFRTCARAAGRKMSVGVFGPSQAGKSYLISALARGANNELGAIFDKDVIDFISKINPEGGKESTGLVTRFTLSRDPAAPAGSPVRLSMLSEMDIVKIVANTYYADCEHKETPTVNPETMAQLRKQATGASHVTLDDMEDLREYIVNEFRARPRVQELEREYWDEALELAPKLDLEGRVKLYSVIWDEVDEFTNLLRKLLQPLAALDNPETCYCSLDALVPRERSIIDVATLADLDTGQPELELVTAAGRRAKLPRAVVTALVAELTIEMAEKPAPYFEHTDLLDFPGYRSRYKLDDVRRELKKPGMLKELFLRGKVAYLFQRYSAQRELNGMLLCIGPSNQEVQDLPAVINSWINSTHGETPEQREGRQVSLFLVLTKFDMEFEEKTGAPSVATRWDTRLHTSLLDFFGKQHDWPAKWTPQHGFNNIFLLRNPNYKFKAVLAYDDAGREVGILDSSRKLVGELQSAFLQSPLVARHFAEPGRAWDEAMKLNDGGISYLRESLSPICDPAIKRRQLLENVNACRMNLARRLEAFYQSDDRGELTKKKLQLIVSLFQSLGEMEKQRHRLGHLLRSFTISDMDIFNMHKEAMRRHREEREQAGNSKPAPVAEEAIDLAALDFGKLNPFEGDEEDAAPEPARDEADSFAAHIEGKWVEQLHALADDPKKQTFFMLPEQQFSALASELATGVERLGLREKMAAEFRRVAAYANTQKTSITRRQAALAARMINEYVDWLGFNPHNQNDAERTVQLPGNRNTVVFQPAPTLTGLPVLGEKRGKYTQKWFGDWLNAMAGLILENVNFDGKKTINVQENLALGEILTKFETQPAGV